MTLTAGSRLDVYQIDQEIGRGGMGVVYRARDLKLDRDVAIKALPEGVTDDTERMARFAREAKLLASLRHANIAAVYGLEEVEGQRYLVLEYVDGEDLASRLQRGPIPIDEALVFAKEIAEAIGAAHEQGIIHRDLKPGNVKVTEAGDVKVLDFGLAKALSDQPSSMVSDPSLSPTVITAAHSPTMPGVILGTAGYMSPEQARCRAADKRSDIWSFGCILFEMLTGARVFPGETATESLGAILHKDPEWSLLPPGTPPTIQLLLRRCLTKDRKRRLQDIGDARIELEEVIADPTATSMSLAGAALAASAPPVPATRRVLPWALTALLAAALVAAWVTRPTVVPPAVGKFTMSIPDDQSLLPFSGRHMSISRDGSQVVWVGRGTPWSQLFLRPLDHLEAHPVPNTSGAWAPLFSPDGQWIAFSQEDKLKKISTQGGPPMTLCDAPRMRGADWGPDGTIVFAPRANGSLYRVSEAGGTAEPLTEVGEDDKGMSHRYPTFLPDGRAVIFTAAARGGKWDEAAVMAYVFETGEQKELVRGASFGMYVDTGHLLHYRDETIMAAPFDLERIEVTGPAAPVLEAVAGGNARDPAQFVVARSGTLVYLEGTGSQERTLVLVDHDGREEPLTTQRRRYINHSLSPDDRRVAVTVEDESDENIWVLERERDILRPLTFDPGADDDPVWSPDGEWIAFCSDRDGDKQNLYVVRSDFTGTPRRLTTSEFDQRPFDWSHDGTMLVYMEIHPGEGGGDIHLMRLDEQAQPVGEPVVLANRPQWEWDPKFSPDDRWILYGSAESGRGEIYVRAVSGRGAPVQVSTERGFIARWSPDRDTLFYANQDAMHAVAFTVEDGVFKPEPPEELFKLPDGAYYWWDADISHDGLHFSKLALGVGERQRNLTVVLNWPEELKAKLPGTNR